MRLVSNIEIKLHKRRDNMNKQEIYFKSSKMLELVNDLTLKAKEINMIKPVKEAFKDISATKEVHKGKKEYFCD